MTWERGTKKWATWDLPGTFDVAAFGERVDVDEPEVGALRVGRHQRFEHGLAALQFAQFHLQLAEAADQLHVCPSKQRHQQRRQQRRQQRHQQHHQQHQLLNSSVSVAAFRFLVRYDRVISGFTGFYRVLPSFTEFHWV